MFKTHKLRSTSLDNKWNFVNLLLSVISQKKLHEIRFDKYITSSDSFNLCINIAELKR